MRCVLLLGILATAAFAQPSNVYVVIAPGGGPSNQNTLQAAVGGEFVIKNSGVGVGAEVGAIGVGTNYVEGATGVVSVNGYYHFIHRRALKFDPFVTGGYTAFFDFAAHENLGNFGFGTNYWFKRFFGVRAEFRDQVQNVHLFQGGSTTSHWWSVRLGVVF
jgi:hypothetical protein